MRITLINAEYNNDNGLLIELLAVTAGKTDSSLFALWLSKSFICIDVLFNSFIFYDKQDKTVLNY
jgi:hypothetical protein